MNIIPLVALIEDHCKQGNAPHPNPSRLPSENATASGREVGRPSLDSLPATFNPWTVLNEVRW